jgi:hypothetical protein
MDGDSFKETNDTEALAHLVGMTNAGLANIDEQIVSGSANLQKSQDNWNPSAVLKEQMLHQQAAGGMPPPSPSTPLPISPGDLTPMQLPVQQPVHQPVQQPVVLQAATPPEVKEQLDRIEAKLDKFTDLITNLTTLDKKMESFIQRGLKDKVRQITLKLDGNSNR